MSSPTIFTEEQVNLGVSLVEANLLDILNNSSKASEAFEKIEKNTYEKNLEQPDGVEIEDSDEVSYDDIRNQYNELLYKWESVGNTPEGDALIEKLNQLEAQYPDINFMERTEPDGFGYKQVVIEQETAKKEADRLYYETSQEKQPATPQQVKDSFEMPINIADLIIEQGINAIKNPPPLMQKAKEKSANDPKKLAKFTASEKLFYAENTTESNGEPLKYKVVGQKVDWGRLIAEEGGTPEYNLAKFRAFVTQTVRDYFGGFDRIKTIVVRGENLIINNVCYSPMIDNQYLQNSKMFPLDVLDYIKDGRVAPLFNWKYLRSMRNLTLLDIDDTNFYITDIASDIGVGRRAGLTTIFKYIPSLEIFILGGEKVSLEDLESNTESAKVVKKKISMFKHFKNFEDGYKFSVLSGTNSLQAYTVNNFKNYANNRGDKGWLKFTGGVLVRGALAGVGLGINGIAHLAKGVFNTVKEVYKAGTTPVDMNDVMN